jgi:hypothetical protein
MKKILIIMMMLTGVVASYGMVENPIQEVIEKYNRNLENSLKLPTDFAGHIIVDKSAIELLKGKTIYKIELVYTRYKSSPDFDQNALNNRRVAQLKNLVPQVVSDNPTWSFVEQTGAVTKEVAETYFHGFVIHYSDKLDYQSLSTYFEDFSKTFTSYEIDNTQKQEVKYSSGTVIHIEPNSVTYADGKPVTGNYNLEYREFRNPAEIALSGIPMTINEHGEMMHFSSVGMYEIKAFQDGEELKLKKPIEVDFNCTDVKQDVSFYQMNKEGEWKTIKPIDFGTTSQTENTSENKQNSEVKQRVEQIENSNTSDELKLIPNTKYITNWQTGSSQLGNIQVVTTYNKDRTYSVLNDDAWKSYVNKKKENPDSFKDIVLGESPAEQKLRVVDDGHMKLIIALIGVDFGIAVNPIQSGNISNQPMFVPNDKYSTVVQGLSSSGFGVYNCDQTYRIQNQVALAPTYINEADSSEISNKYTACLIDLNYNGSFTYHPNNIVCNSLGRNVLLLFTTDKRIFMLPEKDFANLDKSNAGVTMHMQEVTEQIKSPNDLKQLLSI